MVIHTTLPTEALEPNERTEYNVPAPGLGSVRQANSLTVSTTNYQSFIAFIEAEDAPSPRHVHITRAATERDPAPLYKKGCCSVFKPVYVLVEKYPVSFVIAGAVIGLCLGIGLSQWDDSTGAKAVTMQWIGLFGDVFIRALKCIVLPLVFVSIAISVMDMLALGDAGSIVGLTIGLYVCTTIFAACVGCTVAGIFSHTYVLGDGAPDPVLPDILLGCDGGTSGTYLAEQADGSITCAAAGSTFLVEDLNGYFQKSKAAEGLAELTLSESIYDGLFLKMAPNNMMGVFYDNNFLGAIVLGAGFGIALNKMQKQTPQGIKWDRILTVQLMEELNEIFIMFIRWIVSWTPLAIISLIATAIGKTNGFVEVLSSLGFLSVATCLGMCIQFLFCYCPMYFIFKRKNPFSYFKQMAPVFTLAFASSSSAATLPVTISCAVNTGEVTQGIANFSLPLGATTNMDGTSIHIVSSCIWLAYYNGIVPTPVNYFLLIFCATLGSMGAAPVPSASIVLIMTSYQTTFGGSGEPPGLGLIMAIDWLIDRFRTMTNICGDLTVAACVSEHTERKVRELSERGDFVKSEKKLEDLEEFHEQAMDSDHQPKPVN